MFIDAMFTIAKLGSTMLPKNWWVDKETMVYVYHGILLSHKEKWNYVICMKMYGTGDHHIKWDKPSSKS
jgi:hypothetical protein